MAVSIYNVPAWASSTLYRKHTPVTSGGFTYYALVDHTSGSGAFSDDISKWGGIATDYNGEIKPNFIWKPDFGFKIIQKPMVKKVQFGDGYSQRIKDGINNNLLSAEMSFTKRTVDEITAIVHFLYARQGVDSFLWEVPFPFGVSKRFVCEEFPASFDFYNNHSLACKFEESMT